MLVFHGRKNATLKTYQENHQTCSNCGALDLTVSVYRQYYHIYFIPIFPISRKVAGIRCNSCGESLQMDSLQKDYEDKTKTPIYLFSFLFLIAALITWGVIASVRTGKNEALFVANPAAGDVYLVKDTDDKNATIYYYLRVTGVNKDSVSVYHTHLQYDGFVSKLSSSDYFDKTEELVFTKAELKKMLDKGEIDAVKRNYGDDEGFNRIK